MSEKCKYCGSDLAFCHIGEYCSNPKCGYVDGYYFGPRQETTLDQVDKELAALEKELKRLNKRYVRLCRQKVRLTLPPGQKPKTLADILHLL